MGRLRRAVPVRYLLRDDFDVPAAAGSVNGTLPRVGGARVVADAENKLSVGAAGLTFAGGKATPAYGDPYLRYPVVARRNGQVLVGELTTPATTAEYLKLGFTHATSGAQYVWDGLNFSGGNVYFEHYSGSAISMAVSVYTTRTAYRWALVMRATGLFLFLRRTGTENRNGTWKLMARVGVSTAAFYPGVSSYSAACELRSLAAPRRTVSGTPQASDSFARADGALGLTDGLAVAEGGGGRAWREDLGAIAIASNAAKASALDSGVAIATLDAGTPDVLHSAAVTRGSGVAGIVLRYVDPDNYVYAVHDGTNAKLIKRVGGTETTVATAAKTYAAGAPIEVTADGDKFSLRYNLAHVGSPALAISDAVLQTSTRHGLYFTDTDSTLGALETWPTGTEGQYAVLSRFFTPKAAITILPIGDSKTSAKSWIQQMNSVGVEVVARPEIATPGWKTSDAAAAVDAALAAQSLQPDAVLMNLGANDVSVMPDEATWKANTLHILDAIHSKWPASQVYLMRVWRRGYAAECNTLAGWVGDVASARSAFCHLGPDERIFLEAGDDGATYTSDGIHPNDLGYQLTAGQWRTSLGYAA